MAKRTNEANVTKTKMTVPISRRAFRRRFAAALAKRRQVLRAPRGRGSHDGEYFIMDARRREPVATQLKMEDLVRMGRELGALEPWEEVEHG
jgi:hypothetical protein